MPLDYRLINDPLAPIGHLSKRDQRRVCELRTAYSLAMARSAGRPMTSPEDVYALLAPAVKGLEVEQAWLIVNSTGQRAICEPIVVHRGTRDSCDMDPRAILQHAFRYPTAQALILAHNHPSMNDRPSTADMSVTRTVAAACRAVGFTLADHLVCTELGFCSMRREYTSLFQG